MHREQKMKYRTSLTSYKVAHEKSSYQREKTILIPKKPVHKVKEPIIQSTNYHELNRHLACIYKSPHPWRNTLTHMKNCIESE